MPGPPGSGSPWGDLLLTVDIYAWARAAHPAVRESWKQAAVQAAPHSSGVGRAAESAMRTLAHRSAGAQRIPIVDYLVAAAAQEMGGAVIHYDRDYDTLATVMEFGSVWLAPAGTLP